MTKTNRALIFANGILEDSAWLSAYIQPDDFLIAADGGGQILRGLDLLPELLIGDLDSIPEELYVQVRDSGARIIKHPEDKDQTDLELALDAAVQRGFGTIRILAALGGRLDQTLGNIFLLTSPSLKGLDVRIEDGNTEVMLVQNHIVIDGKPGDGVSLLPINGPAHNIYTFGLKYPLKHESLFPEHTRGISNEMVGSAAKIVLEKGYLLCIHTRVR